MATVAAGAKEQSSRRLKEGCSVKDILDKVQKKGGETSCPSKTILQNEMR